ncbi:inositol hexakisphosphate kinase 3-like isoform X2 [Babylonia areolata]|uniref:inositol hexakisphosphate kinase 3-like isoform X2 n=1 Tax=Babylonia areolata TaxID=304850 RepID=UPI003FD4A155
MLAVYDDPVWLVRAKNESDVLSTDTTGTSFPRQQSPCRLFDPRRCMYSDKRTTTTTMSPTRSPVKQGTEEAPVVREAAELLPFKHQVAGHSPIFLLDSGTICKATSHREIVFYQTTPDLLKGHVPSFKGIVTVDLDGADKDNKENQGEKRRKSTGKALSPQNLRRLKKLAEGDQGRANACRFILLENVVEGFRQPCVVDLKLGCKERKYKNPNKTTQSLGLALCGMRVYHNKTGEVTLLNKEDGRHLDENDFPQTVRHFLFDGQDFRRDLIPSIVQKLADLRSAINQLQSYRFFSSSVLIAYDAADEVGGKADVRLVDFAYTTHAGFPEGKVHAGVDEHSSQGLQTLIDILSDV